MSKINDMQELMHHELSDLLNAEEQILEALPKMIGEVSEARLKQALESHRKETEGQVKRLQKCFKLLGDKKPGGEKCKGMAGIIAEGEKMMKDIKDPEIRDAAIIGAAQKVEHYEMATYGTMRTLAQTMGLNEIADLLQQTLDEEGEADKKLTAIAEGRVNQKAAS